MEKNMLNEALDADLVGRGLETPRFEYCVSGLMMEIGLLTEYAKQGTGEYLLRKSIKDIQAEPKTIREALLKLKDDIDFLVSVRVVENN